MRRDAVAVLLGLEALWFAAGLGWTSITHVGIDGLMYPSWAAQVVELALAQAASTSVVVVLGVLVLRGSDFALNATLVLAAIHMFIQVGWSLTGFLLFPWYLLLVPLPFAAPFVLAAPILVLCVSIRRSRSLESPTDR